MIEQGDLHSIVTADGKAFYVPDEENRFLAYVGYGAPTIEYITRRAYKQHGLTKVDSLLSARALTITLWKKAACSRLEYWQNRAALHDLLRPNRGGSALLTLTLPDGGGKRSIYIDANPGAAFTGADDNSWALDEPLEFTAFDPVWFDPDTVRSSPASELSTNLVFPITFNDDNIVFGTSGTQFNVHITYLGSWPAYPVLTIKGPYTAVTIQNLQTLAIITLNVPIAGNEYRIITLAPNNLSVVNELGADKFGDLGPLTNLVDFSIQPDPTVPGGVQTIQALFTGGSPASQFIVEYNTRYYAI